MSSISRANSLKAAPPLPATKTRGPTPNMGIWSTAITGCPTPCDTYLRVAVLIAVPSWPMKAALAGWPTIRWQGRSDIVIVDLRKLMLECCERPGCKGQIQAPWPEKFPLQCDPHFPQERKNISGIELALRKDSLNGCAKY